MICLRNDPAVIQPERIIGLRPCHIRESESAAERYAFYGRYGEKDLTQTALHRVEERISDPCREPCNSRLYDSADRVSRFAGFFDFFPHQRLFLRVKHRKLHLCKSRKDIFLQILFGKSIFFYIVDLENMASHTDAFCLKRLPQHCAGKYERCCDPGGKMSPAPDILKTLITDMSRIIRM